MNLHEIAGSMETPYEYNLDMARGTVLSGGASCPDVVVVENQTMHVRHIMSQMSKIRDVEGGEFVDVIRIVAVIEGGGEVCLMQSALPSDATTGKRGVCASCGMNIPTGAEVEHDGQYYHHGCMRG